MASKKAAAAKPPRSRVETKTVPINTLRFDPENVRTHDDRNKTEVRASLEDHGQVQAVVVQKRTKRIIAGNCTVEQMLALGHKTVEVRLVDCDDLEARRLAVRLNRTGELGGYDFDRLQTLVDELDAAGITPNLGFTEEEFDELRRKALAPIEEDSDGDEPGGGDQSGKLKTQYQVLVILDNEKQQAKLLERLAGEGYECRALVS